MRWYCYSTHVVDVNIPFVQGHLIVLVDVESLSCVQVYNLMDCSTPAFPVVHCLPEFAQILVH